MESQAEKSKRIAKNTAILYIRMLLSMLVMFYTSRIVLNGLGVENYGIYNAVSGVVALFSCLKGSMVTVTQRYMSYAIGKSNSVQLNSVFSSSLVIHGIIGLLILLVGEITGQWLIVHKMIIPADQLGAAKWVFHLSLITLVIDLFSIPYNALLIAYEKMTAFAYISIINVLLKLLVSFLLLCSPVDKLIWYASWMLFVTFLTGCMYAYYCRYRFAVAHFKKGTLQKHLIREMSSFASYSFIGDLACTSYIQGTNVLLNIFFGPIVNAAFGIAVQVQNAIGSFAVNFQTALNPQITKSYVRQEYIYLRRLIAGSIKYTFFLLFLFSFPLMLETEQLLTWWLNQVPPYTVAFIRVILGIVIVVAMANPLTQVVHATGNIRKYQLMVGGGQLLILPFSYGLLKLNSPPVSVLIACFFFLFQIWLLQMYYVKHCIPGIFEGFKTKVTFPILKVVIFSSILPLFIYKAHTPGFFRFATVNLSFFFIYIPLLYRIGMEDEERRFVSEKVKKWLSSFCSKKYHGN